MALGKKWFGKLAVTLFGRDIWDAQPAEKVWSDGGSIRQLLDEANRGLQAGLEKIVAENAVLAVSDFASTATAALRGGEQGEVVLGIRIASDQTAQIIEIPLRDLIKAALTEIRPSIGVDPQAQEILSALVTLGQQLTSLARPPAPPVVERELVSQDAPLNLGKTARPVPGRIISPQAPLSRQAVTRETLEALREVGGLSPGPAYNPPYAGP